MMPSVWIIERLGADGQWQPVIAGYEYGEPIEDEVDAKRLVAGIHEDFPGEAHRAREYGPKDREDR